MEIVFLILPDFIVASKVLFMLLYLYVRNTQTAMKKVVAI
jgi:hypothetical protein